MARDPSLLPGHAGLNNGPDEDLPEGRPGTDVPIQGGTSPPTPADDAGPGRDDAVSAFHEGGRT